MGSTKRSLVSGPGGLPAGSNPERTAALALCAGDGILGSGVYLGENGRGSDSRRRRHAPRLAFRPCIPAGMALSSLEELVWLLVFPAARRGWTWRGVGWSVGVGALLTVGLVAQHLGLDRTSEAVSAFLTSLTILFVPLLMTVVLRKPPRALLWVGIALATIGVWLMTGQTPSGFGRGELLGLTGAFGFSLYILAVNAAVARESAYRMTAGQFITVGLLCLLTCAFLRGGAHQLTPAATIHLLSQTPVWLNLLLLSAFPTIAAFGLLTFFQPKLDPTRAALIYLLEPIIASVYAMVAVGHYPGKSAWAGAILILLANALVEALSSRQIHAQTPVVID